MCVAYLALSAHPDYPWIVAINRDEFLNRAAIPAQIWNESPQMIAGKDVQSNGTWFGVTQNGRYGLVTNYRNFALLKEGMKSRGSLVKEYLQGNLSPEAYLKKVNEEADLYNPFNLILGDANSSFYYSSLRKKVEPIGPGVHGLSNGYLNDPWPKVVRGKAELEKLIGQANSGFADPMLTFLKDPTLAKDNELPDTGVGLDLERSLSSVFVDLYGKDYGTRSSTVALFNQKGEGQFYEVTYDLNKTPHLTRLSFGKP